MKEDGFAIDLENSAFVRSLLEEAKSAPNAHEVFHTKMQEELMAVREACLKVMGTSRCLAQYLVVDTNVRPSLDKGGSVAGRIEFPADVCR